MVGAEAFPPQPAHPHEKGKEVFEPSAASISPEITSAAESSWQLESG